MHSPYLAALLLVPSFIAACGDDATSSDSATDSGTTNATSVSGATDTAPTTAGSVSESNTGTTTESGTVSDSMTSGTTTGETSSTGTTTTTTDSGTSTTGMPGMCADDPPPGFGGEPDPECKSEVQVGLFEPTVEWKKSSFAVNPSSNNIGVTPLVASMNDDNNDGKIDEQDIPDVIFTTFSPATLRVISGADGAELVSVTPPNLSEQAGAAIGDIDGDGSPEILVMGGSAVHAIEHDGTLKWTTGIYPTEDIGGLGYAWPSISDMDNDGDPEIIVGRLIFNHDGTLQGKGSFGKGSSLDFTVTSFAVDIDDDGTQEVVVGNALYDPTGAAIWSTDEPDGYPAVADFDLDGVPEIVVVSPASVRLQSSVDGSVLWQSEIPVAGGRGGPPTIADFDGDGSPEIGVAGALYYVVFDGDGSILWQNQIEDGSSSFTGSSVYDFEGDGVADVVYADETALWVFSGVDGAVKLKFDDHFSDTWFEYPIIVDVDGDDQVEILVASTGVQAGLTVIGDAQESWRPGRKVWNQHSYHITNVNDDGTIPSPSLNNWELYNNFRSGDLSPNDGQAAPDLVLGEAVICEEECVDDLLVISAHLGNIGASALTGGATVEVMVVIGGVEMQVDSFEIIDPLDAGAWLDAYLYELDPTDVEQVVFRVTAKEEECSVDNNELVIDGPFCSGS